MYITMIQDIDLSQTTYFYISNMIFLNIQIDLKSIVKILILFLREYKSEYHNRFRWSTHAATEEITM